LNGTVNFYNAWDIYNSWWMEQYNNNQGGYPDVKPMPMPIAIAEPAVSTVSKVISSVSTSFSSISPVFPGILPRYDDSKNKYRNHVLIVDTKSSNFRVVYTDLKNPQNDVVIEANSV
jgi:hypothetical protein